VVVVVQSKMGNNGSKLYLSAGIGIGPILTQAFNEFALEMLARTMCDGRKILPPSTLNTCLLKKKKSGEKKKEH